MAKVRKRAKAPKRKAAARPSHRPKKKRGRGPSLKGKASKVRKLRRIARR